jgi:hypothetical protein
LTHHGLLFTHPIQTWNVPWIIQKNDFTVYSKT